MDILEGLNRAMGYIEGHLRDEPDMEQAARLAAQTADGFARLFRSLTGSTLPEYIRSRRLSLAAYDLQDRRCKVIDAAVAYGYESADAFRRAFMRQHGVPPSKAQNPGCPLKIVPPLRFHINFTGGKAMDFKIIEQPRLKLMGLCKAFEGAAAERFEQEHIMWADHHDNIPARISEEYPGTWYGIWDSGDYWIARAPDDATGSGLAEIAVSGGTYAMFRSGCGGFAGEELPKLRKQIFEAWLADSGWKQSRDCEVEVYHLMPKSEKAHRYYEIWLPVERA